jgi:four helix bundle protein
MVRSADSIGANIVEGNGRYHFKDNQRFVKIARASFNETRHWLTLASHRHLLTHQQMTYIETLIKRLSPMLNKYLNSLSDGS